ncbi:hypothetical protein B7494_g2781 [Chlorociboria aeruginascens]|nr:hypothetical protein B7494_g2781 [Chlorociboria aeruginascens]
MSNWIEIVIWVFAAVGFLNTVRILIINYTSNTKMLLVELRLAMTENILSNFNTEMNYPSGQYSTPGITKYLTVVSHRGQETFNIAIMGFRNSPAYCQRQMNSSFQGLGFAKAYIDDIIVASRTFDEHLQHLRTICRILLQHHITVKYTRFLDDTSDF